MLPTKFRFIWPSGYRGEYSLEINQSETKIACGGLADFFKSSPLKLLFQMNRNLVGSIYGKFSIKIAHFVPIREQTWPPQAIFVYGGHVCYRIGTK
jgi:hypothetical protein